MRMMLPLLMVGCLERVTGEVVPLDSRFTAQPSHASGGMDDTGGPVHADQEHKEVTHQEEAPPQPFADVEGEKVSISGTLISETAGSVDVDVSVVDASADGGLVSAGKLILEGPGAFSFEVPVGVGILHVAAFQDLEKDGPSENDPYAQITIDVAVDPMADLEMLLVAGARSTAQSGPEHTAVPPPQPFDDFEGEWVAISGTIISEMEGAVDLDVGREDEASPGGLVTEGKLIFSEAGAFSFDVPVDIGALRLAAFQDLEKDGPSEDDPYAELRVEVGSEPLQGIEFTLVVGARSQGAGSGPEHVEAPPGFGSGQAPPPDGTPTQSDPFSSYEGERVTVSGLLVWDGDEVVDLDLFTPDTSAGGGRRLLGKLKKKVGAFSIKVPMSLGMLELDAFADLTGDGPTGDDPRATVRNISLTEGSVTGLQVLLTSLVEDAPPAKPESGGTDIEEEFARTVGGSPSSKQTGDGL